MKPFPPAEQLQFLVGPALASISLGRFIISFHFDNLAWISAEHAIEYGDGGEVESYDIQAGMGPVRFHKLLLESVTRIDVQEWRLTLTFESGRTLSLISRPGPYESGQIASGKGPEESYVY